MNTRSGNIYALVAFAFWGFAPIYWVQLRSMDVYLIVFNRCLWGGHMPMAPDHYEETE